jgi:hypothetical protein
LGERVFRVFTNAAHAETDMHVEKNPWENEPVRERPKREWISKAKA